VATLDEAGPAYQRQADGELAVRPDGPLLETESEQRWTVSGRVEYDNKGLTVRVFQAFFVNDWRYVKDASLRAQGYADTHFYDALGRECRVETALGYLRRHAYFPWFSMAEDENDTAHERLEPATAAPAKPTGDAELRTLYLPRRP
jgi:hypothetical protein